ncbi:BspA family leucine-rich repeat surface protein [Candidatus Saccharibacteria bacterium]|nr:BspA family leucine-rich repeat surface protein [Candidatus Saccharibacteria bacterium]
MKNRKKIGIFAALLVLSAAVFVPLYAVFAANEPVRSIDFESHSVNYENGDPGSWHIDKSAYWTKMGYANIDIEVKGNPVPSKKIYDMVLILDESGSMFDGQLAEAKVAMTDFSREILSDGRSRMALIGFDDNSRILTNFTQDADRMETAINSLYANGSTSFYAAMSLLNHMLEGYEPEDGRELVVVFVSDGFANTDVPREVAEYKLLKERFPKSRVQGIQYSTGYSGHLSSVTDDSRSCNDIQGFKEALVDASGMYKDFDSFVVADYINDQYFEPTGVVKGQKSGYAFDTAEDGTPRFTWNVANRAFSGAHPKKITIEIKLKDEYYNDEDGIFPTNKKLEASSSIEGDDGPIEENLTTELTPKLKLKYWLYYEANAPEGCQVNGEIPEPSEQVVFSRVRIADDTLTCGDWIFKGWVLRTDTAERLNKDYFLMGNDDTYIEGTWGRPALSLSTEGTVWQESYALLDTGENVNKKLRTLATSNVLAIKKADDLLTERITSANNRISASNSPINIYAWFDTSDQSLYIYSDADTIKGNPNSTSLFSGANSAKMRTIADYSGVADWDMSGVTTLASFMSYVSSSADLSAFANWDVSNLKSLNGAFVKSGINNYDGIGGWNVSSVENTRGMFEENSGIVNIDALSEWDLSNVTDAGWMFYKCSNLVSISGARNWGVNKVTRMDNFVTWSKKVTSLDGLQDWDVSNVTVITNAFSLMDSLTDISALEKWNTSSMVKMYGLFYSDSKLADFSALRRRTITKEDGTSYITWDVSNNKDFGSFFMGTKFSDSTILTDWDVSSAESLYRMFYSTSLTNTDGLANWDTSNVTEMNQMFSGANGLTSLQGLSKWNTSKVYTIDGMFAADYITGKLTNLTGLEYKLVEEEGKEPYYAWDLSNVTAMGSLFSGQDALQNVDAMLDWKIPKVTSLANVFYGCKSLSDISGLRKLDVGKVTNFQALFTSTTALRDLTPIQGWDMKNAQNFSSIFYGSGVLDLTPIRGWDVGKVTTIYNAFSNTSIATLEGLQDWKPCSVTAMKETFRDTKQLASISQLAGWAKKDDGSACIKPTDLTGTFYNAGLTSTHGLEDWDIRGVTSFNQTFENAKSLTDLTGLSGEYWNQSKTAVASYQAMFRGATGLVSLNGIGGWPMDNTKNVREMFNGATNLENIDALGTWKPTVLNDMYRMFRSDAKLTTEDLAVLENWNATLTVAPSVLQAFDGIPDDVVRPTLGPVSGD